MQILAQKIKIWPFKHVRTVYAQNFFFYKFEVSTSIIHEPYIVTRIP